MESAEKIAMDEVYKFISEYLNAECVKLPCLAQRTGIPHSTLHRAYNMEYPLKHHYFRMLLNEITKAEAKTISIMFEIPYYRNYAERQRRFLDVAESITDPIEKALIETSTFKVALLATYGTTKDEIQTEYGNDGLIALKMLSDKKYLIVSDSGEISLPDYKIPALESATTIMTNALEFLKSKCDLIDEIRVNMEILDSDSYKELLGDVRALQKKFTEKSIKCKNKKGNIRALFGVFIADINRL